MNVDLISLLIGGVITLCATFVAHSLQARKEKRKHQETLNGVLQGIHDEVETLWERYMEGTGSKTDALAPGEPLLQYYPLTQEYFRVYTANSSLIGEIENHQVRRAIVTSYTKMGALIDCYRFNNDLFQKFIDWTLMYEQTSLPIHDQFANRYHQALVEFADDLKRLHDECKEQIEELLQMLRIVPSVVVSKR